MGGGGYLLILSGQKPQTSCDTCLPTSAETFSERGALTRNSEPSPLYPCSHVDFNLVYTWFRALLYHQLGEFVSKAGWLVLPVHSPPGTLSCCCAAVV